ncbi:MAG: hypothetical protein M5U28_24515 [Sandaracinaceae bacterium]|nr:hypothetical protein [Sandaracinaceae bacterium]
MTRTMGTFVRAGNGERERFAPVEEAVQPWRVQVVLLAGLLAVCATAAPPPAAAPSDEAGLTALRSPDAGSALRGGADLSAVPSAPAPRRVHLVEALAALAPRRALAPRPVVYVAVRAPRRRVPRMTVDGAADH